MKNQVFLFILISLSLSLGAQAPAYNTINANNIKAGIHANGSMFMDESGTNLGFNAPYIQGLDIGTIFSAGIWMSATDNGGNLKVTQTTYGGQINNNAYYSPGPYNASTINTDFNKVWTVKRSDIMAHIADFADGQIDNQIPASVWEWPASGNPIHGLPNQLFAPFYDQDGDGLYDPESGDYPIAGSDLINVIPDEMMYTIVNDNSPSFGNPLGVELHTLMFGFNCTNSATMKNTLFARHTVINRSPETLNNFKFSLWMDPDLGCFTDDMMGCDTLRNAFYIYNEDALDGDVGTSCPAGINTYANQPPVQSIVILNQKMENFHYYVNCGISNPPPAQCSPNSNNEYANAMNSIWRDDLPLTYGGDGYNPASQQTTKFAFPDVPNDPAGWSMHALSLSHQDRRVLASCGNPQLQPGQLMTIDYAYIFTQRSGADNIENVIAAFNDIDEIQGIYDNGFSGTCNQVSASKNLITSDQIGLSPNPTQQKIQLSNALGFERYQIVDELGRMIKNGTVKNGRSTLDLEDLQGVYFLILSNDTQRITKKIVAL